jgi:hypothetical protein
MKKIAVPVRQYSDRNRSDPIEPGTERTADAPGTGSATVGRIAADYNRDPELPGESAKIRGRPVHAVSVSYREVVRLYIRSANQKVEYITLENMQDFLKKIPPVNSSADRHRRELSADGVPDPVKEHDHSI